jgi:hypothetical protein
MDLPLPHYFAVGSRWEFDMGFQFFPGMMNIFQLNGPQGVRHGCLYPFEAPQVGREKDLLKTG